MDRGHKRRKAWIVVENSAIAPNTKMAKLRSNLTSASFVMVVSMVMGNVLRLGSVIFLSRLLFPEDYALVGMLMMVLTAMEMCSDMGIMAFMVRHEQSETRRYLDGVWTITMLRGLLLATSLFIAAPFIAPFMGMPEAVLPLQLYAGIFALKGMTSLRVIMAVRDGNEGKNAIFALVVQAIQLVVTIGFAFWLRSYWAIVIGTLVGEVVRMAISYLFYAKPWQKFYLDKELFFELFAFSKFVILSSILSLILSQFDRFYVLKNLDKETAGVYFMAVNLAMPAGTIVYAYFWKVFYPEYLKLSRKSQASADEAYYSIQLRLRALFHFGAGFGLTAGTLIFTILFPEKWWGGGVFFSLLIVRALFMSMECPTEAYLVASGRIKMTLYANIMRLVWLVVAAFFAIQMDNIYLIILAAATIDILPIIAFNLMLWRKGVLKMKWEIGFIAITLAGAGLGWLLSAYGLQYVQ